MKSPALGAAVAALGLSNKAVYAEEVQGSNAGVASGMEGGGYTDGPDLAPNAAPAAVAGQLTSLCSRPQMLANSMVLSQPAMSSFVHCSRRMWERHQRQASSRPLLVRKMPGLQL